MDNKNQNPAPLQKGRNKDKALVLQFIVKQVEIGTGYTLPELKKRYAEDKLFAVGLKYVTTTKKAFCKAMDIPVEAGCRYKRKLEKAGQLVQSVDEVTCPFTKHPAHLISTNPQVFEDLLQSKSNQTKLFE